MIAYPYIRILIIFCCIYCVNNYNYHVKIIKMKHMGEEKVKRASTDIKKTLLVERKRFR